MSSTIDPEGPGENFIADEELKSLLERWIAPQPSKSLDQRVANSYRREWELDEFAEESFISCDKEPLGRLLEDELSVKVQEAVSSLPPLQREALVLFEYEGLTLSEIASMVGSGRGGSEIAITPSEGTTKKHSPALYE